MRIAILGLELGSKGILKRIHRGEFTDQPVDAVKILSDDGVIILAGMMIGAPYESLRDVVTSIKFSKLFARGGADAI